MSSEKRKVGRPRIYEDNQRRKVFSLRNDLIEQIDAEMEKHSKVLGFTINRQQFIEMLLNNWRDK
jgi:RPA family protein